MTKRHYTVECCFWNPEIAQVSVEAESIEDACKKALEEVDWSESRTCYEGSTDTAVSMIVPGKDRDLYLNPAPRRLRIPKAYADKIMTEKA